jgi:hypothetical protein
MATMNPYHKPVREIWDYLGAVHDISEKKLCGNSHEINGTSVTVWLKEADALDRSGGVQPLDVALTKLVRENLQEGMDEPWVSLHTYGLSFNFSNPIHARLFAYAWEHRKNAPVRGMLVDAHEVVSRVKGASPAQLEDLLATIEKAYRDAGGSASDLGQRSSKGGPIIFPPAKRNRPKGN